jgi:ATP-dependent helicase/nuclease subunit B
MATVHLHTSRDPRRLLESAAEGLLRPPPAEAGDPFASPPHLLVLRQGGLRDDLLALAAARGVPGWFDPPVCVFAQLGEWLGETAARPLGDYERVALIERALRETVAARAAGRAAGSVFGRVSRPESYIDALDRLFGELVTEDVTPGDFAGAVAAAPGADAFERMRDAELHDVYARYHALLADAGRRDGRDRVLDAARAVQADAAALARRLGGRREVRIVGLQDLKGGWSTLLAALAASPVLDVVRIYTSASLELPGALDVVVRDEDGAAADAEPGVAFGAGRAGGARQLELLFGAAGDSLDSGEEGSSTDGQARARGQGQGFERPVETHDSGGSGSSTDARARARGRLGAFAGVVRAAFSAPDPDRECDEVAVRVRALVASGVAPHRIAVVARQARPYVDLACDALERVGVPATARRRYAFAQIPVVRAVLGIFAVAAEGWQRHGLVELAEQPYLGLRLDADVLNHIGYRRRVVGLAAWESALETLHADAVELERREAEDEDGSAIRERLPKSERVARALEGFRAFAAQARALDVPRPLAAWLDWLDDFLGNDPWRVARKLWHVPPAHVRIARLDLAGWRGIVQIVGEWRAATAAWPGAADALDVGAFDRRLRQTLSGDAALWTTTRRGVHVLEALAAAQRTFDHVFLVGLDAERVPVRMPRSSLLDESDRARLIAAGLPLEARATWDARERALLELLEGAAAASLTLSWSRQDEAGAEVAQSSYAEALVARHAIAVETIPTARVRTAGMPLVADAAAAAQAAHGARIEVVRETGQPSPWNGMIEAPSVLAAIAGKLGDDFVWSPTQLEAYAKCPFAWFSQRILRVAKVDDPELDLDARVRGTIYHDALHRFYDAARDRVGGPVFLREDDATWALPLAADALRAALAEAADVVWLGHEALRATKQDEMRRELERFIASEIEYNEGCYNNRTRRSKFVRTAVDAHELSFDDLVLERGGIAVRLRGIIDRIETGVDERGDTGHLIAAVDYKTSKGSTPGGGVGGAWADDVVLQVPLYAWALTRLRPGSAVARTEYRAIRQGVAVHTLNVHRIDPKSGGVFEDEAELAKLERALDAVGEHVARARLGLHPAQPARSCGCPPFCHAWEICRVAGGPRSSSDW